MQKLVNDATGQDWGAMGRTNVIGALLEKTLLTTALFNTNINTEVFTAWLSQDLLPKLPKNSVIVMDNATFHRSKTIEEELKKAGHTLNYLAPYSPDLNPIERKWAQAKAMRRRTRCEIQQIFQNGDL